MKLQPLQDKYSSDDNSPQKIVSLQFTVYQTLVKPFFDFTISLVVLLLLCPLLVTVALLLAIAHDGHPFFYQIRPGRNARLFTIVKFKTMNDKTDKQGNLLPDAQRLTTIGKWIRKTSLDEIPQLLNVLKGDMSLVGPRPLLPEYLLLYNQEQRRRHDVKPGITGWAQVNGRNAISWDQKFQLDVWYVDNQSFLLDLKILGLTILKVCAAKDINSKNAATMEIFQGKK